jgi:hypothetical protein
VIFDPVLVAAKAIAMVQDRRALVGLHRQFIEPPAGKFTESLEMRREVLERFLIEIEREKIAQCPIDGPEVEPVTIWSDQVGAGRRDVGDGGRREIAQSTLFGAEAAGIANPVNPLLEPYQIREILEAAHTKVLVALGPVPGTDIWQKVEQVRSSLKHLKAIVQVHGPGDPANEFYSFSNLVKAQPSDRLVSGRQISNDQIAAYTTSTSE